MKTRTLLVDSSYLLKRSFHGAKDVYTTNFGHIGGLYSFLTTVRKMIKDHMINKVVLVWDGEGGGIDRHYIDDAYKANRKTKEWHKKIEMSMHDIKKEREKEASILKQRLRIQEYAEELYLRQIEVNETEADDLIAAYCLQYNNKEEIYIYSQDRDFAQLLDLNITIIFPNLSQPVTKTNYMMHFNHHYSNALVLKIICGDKADNIKGIAGMGEKTLLEHFPELKFRHITVKEICQKAEAINKERVANKLKPLQALDNLLHNIDRLRMNFKLVNLREPMLNEGAKTALYELEAPIDIENRGSKNLIPLMTRDEFLTVYGSTFVQYVEPFYTVITCERDMYNKNEELKKKIL
jgi:5'-3' exonuclease